MTNGLSPAVVARLKNSSTISDAVLAYANLVDRFLAGDPIALAETVSRATDLSKVFHALAQTADDINTLIVANPGTLRDVIIRPIGNGTTAAGQRAEHRRTWP
jgi:hypothetical protein